MLLKYVKIKKFLTNLEISLNEWNIKNSTKK